MSTSTRNAIQKPSVSIVVCTYNPKREIFKNCLKHIAAAVKVFEPIEILLIDNNSIIPVNSLNYVREFVESNRNASVVVEQKQGLTPARLLGIEKSKGDLLIYIDDDNYINNDFILNAVNIFSKHKHVGAASGQVKLIFEEKPESWVNPYFGLLVHREFDIDIWSNLPHLNDTMPCGAGLIVRREVASYYLRLHKEGKRNIQLDRSGDSLFSGGDNDLAACACDIGLSVGLFKDLILDHFIPKSRITKSYLLNLAESICTSAIVFRSFRNEYPMDLTIKNKLANFIRYNLKFGVQKAFYKAVINGEKKGRQILKNQ